MSLKYLRGEKEVKFKKIHGDKHENRRLNIR